MHRMQGRWGEDRWESKGQTPRHQRYSLSAILRHPGSSITLDIEAEGSDSYSVWSMLFCGRRKRNCRDENACVREARPKTGTTPHGYLPLESFQLTTLVGVHATDTPRSTCACCHTSLCRWRRERGKEGRDREAVVVSALLTHSGASLIYHCTHGQNSKTSRRVIR